MKVLTLKCANCGAALQIPEDVESFACSYCGASQMVERSGGIVSLRKVEASLEKVSASANKTASELALARLAGEVAAVKLEHEKKIAAVDEAAKRKDSTAGVLVVVGLIVCIGLASMLGWWSAPLIVGVAFLVYRLIPTSAEEYKAAEQAAGVKLMELEEQIAKHRAIVSQSDRADS